jgi:hypothetical protein
MDDLQKSHLKGVTMKTIAFLMISVAAMIGFAAWLAPASGNADEQAAPLGPD